MSDDAANTALGLAGLRRLAIHARDMLAEATPKPDRYGEDFTGPAARSLAATTLATHVLTLVVDVIAETAVPLDQVEQERAEAAAKIKAADEFADQQRAIAETQKAAADEEAGSAQAWMDDYTNLSGAVAVLLGISEEEFSNLEVDEQVEAVMSAVKASIDAEDASADEDPS